MKADKYKKYIIVLIAITLAVLGYLFFNSGSDPKPDLTVKPGFVVTGHKGKDTYAVLEITNKGDANDTLFAISSPASTSAELHTLVAGKMVKLDSVPLPKRSEVVFTGTPHVMLVKLKGHLKVGQTTTITFDFQKSADQTVTFKVAQEDGHTHEHGEGK